MSENKATRILEDKQFKMLYNAKNNAYMKRKETHKANKGNAYDFLWERYGSKAEQNTSSNKLSVE